MKKLIQKTVPGIMITLSFVTGFTQIRTYNDSISTHLTQLDKRGALLSWYKPEIPGAGYAHVVRLASEFIKNLVPVEPKTGLKLYYVHADFLGPDQDKDFFKGTSGTDWMPNPACVFAGFVQSLALGYHAFTGDTVYIQIVRDCLNHMLQHGTTPLDWPWSFCPYASADPATFTYEGATQWENTGHRGDGLHCLEPDKIGEMGIAYLKFFELTEEPKYMIAALHCADALVKHVRNVNEDSMGSPVRSPWPFRVNARTGMVIDEYTSNVIETVRLFDELLRIRDKIKLNPSRVEAYQKTRDYAWDWMFSQVGPMKTYVWNGYFEDVQSDPYLKNRVQITPMETARYILKHPETDPDWKTHIPALLSWVATVFATPGMDAIREQLWCFEPMGSHTSRYASICALWYEKTGDPAYKEKAFHFFNLATYMCEDNGFVWTGPFWTKSWFSDGYSDYIRHFMEGMGAVPEWASKDEDHLLRSSSVVQRISYGIQIKYRTYDEEADEVFRLVSKPKQILVHGKPVRQTTRLEGEGWTWQPMEKGGVLRIKHQKPDIIISL